MWECCPKPYIDFLRRRDFGVVCMSSLRGKPKAPMRFPTLDREVFCDFSF